MNCIRLTKKKTPQSAVDFVCPALCVYVWKGFDNSRTFGPSSRHFWRMSALFYLFTWPKHMYIYFIWFVQMWKYKKITCPILFLWFHFIWNRRHFAVLCMWLLATMVYKFLIGTFDELMGVMMSPDESSEVLQINSSVGWLLFSDTKMIW